MSIYDFEVNKDFFETYVSYFSLNEILKLKCDPAEIHPDIMLTIDALRYVIGRPIVITALTNGKHAEKSLHNPKNNTSQKCEAIDFKIVRPPQKNKCIQSMLDVGFHGIGVYSWGFHGDIRKKHALWRRENGVYKPLIA